MEGKNIEGGTKVCHRDIEYTMGNGWVGCCVKSSTSVCYKQEEQSLYSDGLGLKRAG